MPKYIKIRINGGQEFDPSTMIAFLVVRISAPDAQAVLDGPQNERIWKELTGRLLSNPELRDYHLAGQQAPFEIPLIHAEALLVGKQLIVDDADLGITVWITEQNPDLPKLF